jgi:hypothetical protein
MKLDTDSCQKIERESERERERDGVVEDAETIIDYYVIYRLGRIRNKRIISHAASRVISCAFLEY